MPEREHGGEELADWLKAHRALVAVARERSGLEAREGTVLLWALRAGVHVNLGYGSFVEYVERLFGYAPRTTLDKLRTAEALESLPELDRALTQGEASWSAVRELARVATAETVREWLAASKGRTVREIERLVSGREPGDRPTDMARPLAERHVLRFEVAAETLATFRQAMKELRQQSGGHLEDDAALLLMACHVLGSPGIVGDAVNAPSNDAGRASYQLSVTLCERCQRGFQEANGERLEVDAAVVDMARCDAQHIGHVGRESPFPEDEAPVQAPMGPPEPHVGAPKPLATNLPSPAAPHKRSLLRYAATSSAGTRAAASCPAADTRRSSICTMFSRGRRGDGTRLITSSSCAERITARCTGVALRSPVV